MEGGGGGRGGGYSPSSGGDWPDLSSAADNRERPQSDPAGEEERVQDARFLEEASLKYSYKLKEGAVKQHPQSGEEGHDDDDEEEDHNPFALQSLPNPVTQLAAKASNLMTSPQSSRSTTATERSDFQHSMSIGARSKGVESMRGAGGGGSQAINEASSSAHHPSLASSSFFNSQHSSSQFPSLPSQPSAISSERGPRSLKMIRNLPSFNVSCEDKSIPSCSHYIQHSSLASF